VPRGLAHQHAGAAKNLKGGRGQPASFASIFRVIMRVPSALLYSRRAANPHKTAVCGEPWMSLILWMYRFARHTRVTRLKIQVYHASLRVFKIFVAQKMNFQNPTIGPSIRLLAILNENRMPPGVVDI
jgi:hypothetical protein